MINEWFDIAWINFTKAILHGQRVDDDGREIPIERVLSDEQRERVYDLNERHRQELQSLLKELAQ